MSALDSWTDGEGLQLIDESDAQEHYGPFKRSMREKLNTLINDDEITWQDFLMAVSKAPSSSTGAYKTSNLLRINF